MNEIRSLKGSEAPTDGVEPRESVTIEVEPRDLSAFADSPFPDDAGPPPPPEVRNVERRVAQRYPAVEGRSWLAWKEGNGFRRTAAWILNISASGCLVVSDLPPPTDRSIWLRLDNPAVPDWTEARLVDLPSNRDGIYAARLVFRGTCPYALMKAVAFGSSRPRPSGPEPSTSWSRNAW
jgi:hypothetical protein